MDSPFDILQIDSDADEGEIEAAYNRRIKETHPDHGGSRREFQRVRAAYEQLVNGGGEEEPTAAGGRSRARPRQTESRVEYLDYEVLDDMGWSLEDGDLFEKASAEGLDAPDYGRFVVSPDETLLQAAENRGFSWPYACRGGACANCAVAVFDGELTTPVDHILPPELIGRGIRLSCVGSPVTTEMQVVYNVKHLPVLDELRLPPRPFRQANPDQ